MDGIRCCDDHGYFAGEACPDCEGRGRAVLPGKRRRRLSKFVSGGLRHFPGDAGLSLDAAGWTTVDDLVAAVERQYDWADREALDGVLATDPKGRFERDATGGTDRVRAAYGHSVDVDLDATRSTVPGTLYHGTDPANLDSILREGLRPMSRQAVHLSGTVADAREVGHRHADRPVVLSVDAAAMLDDGHEINQRGEAVYTTDRVPPDYLSVLDRQD